MERRPGRVDEREVEGIEVVVSRLDLAAVDDRIAEAEEDVLELPPDLRDQVQVATANRGARDRDVDALLGEAAVELELSEFFLAHADGHLERLAEPVELHSGVAVANFSKRELELALTPEVLDSHAVQVFGRGCFSHCPHCGLFQRLRVHGGDCSGIDLLLSLIALISLEQKDGAAPAWMRRGRTATRASLPRLQAGAS